MSRSPWWYKAGWLLCAAPVLMILLVVGAWRPLGLAVLCLALVLADVPERLGSLVGGDGRG